MHPTHVLLAASLAAALTGCGASIPNLVREGRLDEAWLTACERHFDSSKGDSGANVLADDERQALRQALLARTRATLYGRALGREAMQARLGEQVFPTEMVLVQLRMDVTAHVGTGVRPEARLRTGGRPWSVWDEHDMWKLARVEPPVPPGFAGGYSIVGAFADAIIAGLTLGAVDPKLRGTDEVLPEFVPGRPGTGTPVQEDTLILLSVREDECSIIRPARLGEPCQVVHVLAPEPAPNDDYEPLSLDPPDARPPSDALVVRLIFSEDRRLERGCELSTDLALPLPPGPDVAARAQALFDRGPIDVIDAASRATPAGGRP